MKAEEIALKAAELVGGDRAASHGDKAKNFAAIARLWTAYMKSRRDPETDLDAADIGHMMALLKIARTQSGEFNIDDSIDGAGYIACAGEIAAQAYRR